MSSYTKEPNESLLSTNSHYTSYNKLGEGYRVANNQQDDYITHPIVIGNINNAIRDIDSLSAVRSLYSVTGNLKVGYDALPDFKRVRILSRPAVGSGYIQIGVSGIRQMRAAIKQPIDAIIDRAEKIKALAFDWDDDGALPIETALVDASVEFLKQYYNYVSQHYNPIELPEISPCPDGSIDLDWHTPNAQLLINIRKDNAGEDYTAYYYGDKHNNKVQVKGSTPVNEFAEHLAVWMKYLK